MAALYVGAKQYVDLVLAPPMVWEVPLEEARRAIDSETLAAWGELDKVGQSKRARDRRDLFPHYRPTGG